MRGRSVRRGAAAIAAIVAFGVALSGCASDPEVAQLPEQVSGDLPADVTDQIDAAVNTAMQASGSTGAIVGVWAPWSGTYVAGLGTTEPGGEGEAVTADMSFRIGTVTRAMTCDVLYGLADDGKLSVDDSVTEYVSSVASLEDVTLKQLCDSTSGLGNSSKSFISNFLNTPEREWDARGLASRGIVDRKGEAGAGYRSSDAGYLLLGEALRKASGRSVPELIEQYVALPDGLDHTRLPSSAAAVPASNYLPGYRSDGDVSKSCAAPTDYSKSSSSIGYTDSGVVSTIEDLGRYGQLLALTQADDSQERFATPFPVGDATWYQYAGGAYLAGTMVGQTGSTLGYTTSVWSDPESGLTVSVVMNNSRSDTFVGRLGRQLAAIAAQAPAAEGQTQPEIGLPWSADDYSKQIVKAAICPIEE